MPPNLSWVASRGEAITRAHNADLLNLGYTPIANVVQLMVERVFVEGDCCNLNHGRAQIARSFFGDMSVLHHRDTDTHHSEEDSGHPL